MTEVRWHGRGGQGAKSVAELLAAAMFRSGYFVQSFPEYGPERSGAPLQAYTRYSSRPVRLHCGVTDPDIVVVLDDSLLGEVAVTQGLKSGGMLLVSTTQKSEAVAEGLGYEGPVVCIDSKALAAEAGARHGNVVMLGALAALTGTPDLPSLSGAMEELFEGKLSGQAIDANRRAIEIGYSRAPQTSRFEAMSASGSHHMGETNGKRSQGI